MGKGPSAMPALSAWFHRPGCLRPFAGGLMVRLAAATVCPACAAALALAQKAALSQGRIQMAIESPAHQGDQQGGPRPIGAAPIARGGRLDG